MKKFILFAIIAIAAFAGYKYMQKPQMAGGQSGSPAGMGGEMPPMPVDIEIVSPKKVKIWKEFSARLAAVDYVEVRPQISGVITSVKFKDGQVVNKGQVLYIIDTRPYESALNQAQAQVSASQNELALALKEAERAKKLLAEKIITNSLYDTKLSNAEVASANVDKANSQLKAARINLDYAYVKAPISGQVSRAEITQGNLVEAGPNAPILTSIVSNTGIYADFEIDENTYVEHVRAGNSNSENADIKVKMIVGKNEYEGKIHTFDNKINPTSGTIRARAYFDNKDNNLLPGMVASIKMTSANIDEKLLVSEKAVSTDQDRKFVYVMSDEGVATYREVKLGDSVDGMRVVNEGLKDGEKVIASGIARIRPNAKVVDKATMPAPSEDEKNVSTPPKF